MCLAVLVVELSKVSTSAGAAANDVPSGIVSLRWFVNETSAEKSTHLSTDEKRIDAYIYAHTYIHTLLTVNYF